MVTLKKAIATVSVMILALILFSCSKPEDKEPSLLESNKVEGVDLLKIQNLPFIEGPQVLWEGMSANFVIQPKESNVSGWSINNQRVQNEGTLAFPPSPRGIYHIVAHVNEVAVPPIEYFVSVIPYVDMVGYQCLPELKIVGLHLIPTKSEHTFHLHVPDCLKDQEISVTWALNGQTLSDSHRQVSITLENSGRAEIDAYVRISNGTRPVQFRLRKVFYAYDLPQDSAGNENEDEDDPSNEESMLPHECELGQEEVLETINEQKQEPCGMDGYLVVNLQKVTKKVCRSNEKGIRIWVTDTQTLELNRGSCQGQSCLVKTHNGKEFKLADKEKKSGVVIGQIREELNCTFGEKGYYRVYHELQDYSCNNGQAQSSPSYRGNVVEEKECPKYLWSATENWTPCTAACGGEQEQIHVCQDHYGNVTSSPERCGSNPPQVKRVCSGDPEKVRRVESEVKENVVERRQCPTQQIGVIIVTSIEKIEREYACVEHKVQLVRNEVVSSELKENNQCRRYSAHRCSHDSLDINQARGRFAWMQKCQKEVPIIREFLEQNTEFGFRDANGRTFNSTRPLYVTFMMIRNGREVPWIAPTDVRQPCYVPPTAFIASVCVASCATPEQQILVQNQPQSTPVWQAIGEAYHRQTPRVITWADLNNSNRKIQGTLVDQWVTELVEGEHEVTEITMKSGRRITLTPNHPVLLADGRLVLVGDLRAGDRLVRQDRTTERVMALSSKKHLGKVYNVFTQSAVHHHNLVLIGGYWVGSAMFQNEAADLINRRLFRQELIRKTQSWR